MKCSPFLRMHTDAGILLIKYIIRCWYGYLCGWQDRPVLMLITRLSWQLRLIEVQQESAMETDGLYLTAYMECWGVGEGKMGEMPCQESCELMKCPHSLTLVFIET